MKIDINTKFDIGQKVYFLKSSSSTTVRHCSHCRGHYREIVNGVEYLCSHCKGGREEIRNTRYKIASAIVTNIRITLETEEKELTEHEGRVDAKYSYSVTELKPENWLYSNDGNSERKYEQELYSTKEELRQKHADKLAEDTNEGEDD